MKRLLSFTLLLLATISTFAQIVDKKIGDNGLWGFVDSKDTWIVSPKYNDAIWDNGCKLGYFKSEADTYLYGLIDENGKILYGEGIYYIQTGPELDGKQIDYIYLIDKNDYHGLGTRTGEIIIPCKYKWLSVWNKDYVYIKDKTGKYGLASTKGNILIACGVYEDFGDAYYGMVTMKKDGKWGVWGNGKILIPCQYDSEVIFKNDVAMVKKNGQVMMLKNPLKDASQIKIADNNKLSTKKTGGPAVSRYPAPDSEVDRNIPIAKKIAENTFAFIIANENYQNAPVPYALNDGRMFREYCQKALGVPEKNINLYEDATFGNIITAVEKMKSVAEAYEGEACVIFYYAGHGFPDEKQSYADIYKYLTIIVWLYTGFRVIKS